MYDVGWLLCPQIHDFEGKELNSMRTKSCLRNVVFHRHKVGHEWTCLSFTLRIIDLLLVAVNIFLRLLLFIMSVFDPHLDLLSIISGGSAAALVASSVLLA